MNIKAKIYGTPVTIIAITDGLVDDAKVVFIKRDGSLGYTYHTNSALTIIDKDYLPKEIK